MQAPYADPNSYPAWMYPGLGPNPAVTPTAAPAPARPPISAPATAPLPAGVQQALAAMMQAQGPHFAPAAAAGNTTHPVNMAAVPGGMGPGQKLMTLAAILNGRL